MKHKTTIYAVITLILGITVLVGFFMWINKHVEVPVIDSNTNTSSQTSNLVSIAPMMIPVDHNSYMASVKGSIPQFLQASDDFNKKILDGVMGDISDFNKNARADYDAHLKIDGDQFQKEFSDAKGSYYYFNITSNVVQSNETDISVVIHEEIYSGGAHPAHNVISYNYDVKNNKEISITDLASLQYLSSQARDILTKKFLSDANETVLDDNVKQMLYDGTDPSHLENFNTFTFTLTDLNVYFGEYQVAPYVFGEQEITIPRK